MSRLYKYLKPVFCNRENLESHVIFYSCDLLNRVLDIGERENLTHLFVACYVITLKYNIAHDFDFHNKDDNMYCISLNEISKLYNIEKNKLKRLELKVLIKTGWQPFLSKCMY